LADSHPGSSHLLAVCPSPEPVPVRGSVKRNELDIRTALKHPTDQGKVARPPCPQRSSMPSRQLTIDLAKTALIIIDMQRDFLEPGGFGAALGNDVSRLQVAVGLCRDVLAAARRHGLLVIHTREGHRPHLSDAPPMKVERGDPALRIGTPGPIGRILALAGLVYHRLAAPFPCGDGRTIAVG
jgi:hypothetical protein